MSGNYYVSPSDALGIFSRLCLALTLGAIIGWERQARHKPAGLRTNMLVCLGAALFVLVPIQVGAAQESADALSRVIQGIATGVGFVGGGAILHESRSQSSLAEVRGLTSAAAIWVSAALGIAAGAGLWRLGLIGALLCLVILEIFKRLEHKHS